MTENNKKYNVAGISDKEFERLLIDDPDFAKILMNKNITGSIQPVKVIDPPKPKPKRIYHRTNDKNKNSKPYDPSDPDSELCDDPNCNICEKPEPDPSGKQNNKKPLTPKDEAKNWMDRMGEIISKNKKMAYVWDMYLAKAKGVTMREVKDNILFYEKEFKYKK